MKRKIIALCCLLALVISAFVGCAKSSAANEDPSTDPKSAAVLSAYVVEKGNNDILVSSNEGLFFVSCNGAAIEKDGKELAFSDIKPGMTVKIGYDGAVLESYPGQIQNTETIKVVSQEKDKISLYKEAFEYIFDNREKLENEQTIALDFSGITSLSDAQKNALEYVLGNYFRSKTDADVIRSSYEELSMHGRIKDFYFKNGILLSATENQNGSFNISWWKSGTCASGFENCKAKTVGDSWKISYGDAWIS